MGQYAFNKLSPSLYTVDWVDPAVRYHFRVTNGSGLRAPVSTPALLSVSRFNMHRLQENISRSIMADQQKTGMSTFTPRDLYVKANPGLLATAPDMTNPREWYAATSTRKLLGTFVNQYNNVQKEAAPSAAVTRNAALYMALPGIKHTGGVSLPLPVQTESFPDKGRRKSIKSIASHGESSAEEEDPESLKVVGHRATEEGLHTQVVQNAVGSKLIHKNWKIDALAPLLHNSYTKSTYKPDRPPAPLEHRQKTTVTRLDIEKLLPPKRKPMAPFHMEYIMKQTNLHKSHTNALSEKFGDLLLPRQQKDVKDLNDFRQNYFARQKSILNLKLDHNLPLRVREPTLLNPIQKKSRLHLEDIIPILEDDTILSNRSECKSRLSITSSKAPLAREAEKRDTKSTKDVQKPEPDVYRGPFIYDSPRITRPDKTANEKARLNVITLAPVEKTGLPRGLHMSLSKSLESLSIFSNGSHAPIGGSMPERALRKNPHHKSNPTITSQSVHAHQKKTAKIHNLQPFSERHPDDSIANHPSTPASTPPGESNLQQNPQAKLYQEGNHVTVRFMNDSQRNKTLDETIGAIEYANLYKHLGNPPNITVHQATPLPSDAKSRGSI